MDAKRVAADAIKNARSELTDLSLRIHGHPETAFEEHAACAWVSEALLANGFKVDAGVGGIPTALKATYGTGPLHVGICAEYDALPQIGHACGHNVIGAAAVGAALGLRQVADELGLTISVFGTPAEEDGGAKTLMLQAGVFDGVHAAMMVHPYAEERDAMGTLAVTQIDVEFIGKPAHAAAHPQDGLSASAALALAQSGVAFLREHFVMSDRVHGIVAFGGDAPNIVPARTTGRWYVRSESMERLAELEPRIVDIFRGACLMTGCSMRLTKSSPRYTEIKSDARMAQKWRENAAVLGRTSLPLEPNGPKASTDMGNVSYAVPTIHPLIQIDAGGANIHQKEFADAAATESAHEALLYGATAMAWTVIDLATDEVVRDDLIAHPYSVADVPSDQRGYLDESWKDTLDYSPVQA